METFRFNFKVNDKLSHPEMMSESIGMLKLTCTWNDFDSLVKKEKETAKIEKSFGSVMDNLIYFIFLC